MAACMGRLEHPRPDGLPKVVIDVRKPRKSTTENVMFVETFKKTLHFLRVRRCYCFSHGAQIFNVRE
jgi:hypothetical protein